MSLFPAVIEVGAWLEETGGLVGYLLVFVLAMTPAVEPFLVIPVAIGLGFDPVLTGMAAFAGSVSAVGSIVYTQHQLLEWWHSWRGTDGREASDERDSSGRYGRARRLWRRYGLAGLAFAGPLLAGIHLTALVAAVLESDRRAAIGWLSVGLAAWTGGLVVASVAGFGALGLV